MEDAFGGLEREKVKERDWGVQLAGWGQPVPPMVSLQEHV